MRTPIRHRQLRSLALHHRRHPDNIPTRYSTRSARHAATHLTRWTIVGNRGSPCAGPSDDASRVHPGQPALALPVLPQAQDRSGQVAREIPVGVLAGLAYRTAIAQSEPRVAAVVSAAVQPAVCTVALTYKGVSNM